MTRSGGLICRVRLRPRAGAARSSTSCLISSPISSSTVDDLIVAHDQGLGAEVGSRSVGSKRLSDMSNNRLYVQ
jgi:hypothetical protein